jgi:D-amino peptidase
MIMQKKSFFLVFGVFFIALFFSKDLVCQTKLKVYISVDMEGIAGVVDIDQVSTAGKDYSIARVWTTEEANAAVLGALDAGATEIVVNDSHGTQRNLIASEINPAAVLISGRPKPFGMMQDLDETFDAVVFIGYHAQAGTPYSVLDHTIHGRAVSSIRLNGLEVGESQLNAVYAGLHNVPVVCVTGDRSVCLQAGKFLGGEVVTAVVKKGISRYAAASIHPQEACRLIREKVNLGIKNLRNIKPVKMQLPFELEVDFLWSYQADMAELPPQVERIGGRTVRFTLDNPFETFRLLRAVIDLGRPK